MALTSQQKTDIVFYLGWSGLTLVSDSSHFSNIISDRIELASTTTEICKIVKRILKKLENLDECLEKAKCRLAASSVDNITMNEREIEQLLKERKRCIRELSDLLDISVVKSSSRTLGVCV